MKNNNVPLNARVHYRRTKEIITAVGNYEGIKLDAFDLNHITCYATLGDNLKGNTVSYSNSSTHESCWVSDNQYEIFEVPAKNNFNKYNFCGSFLFLAHDIDYDYWLFGTLKDTINYSETKKKKDLVENVSYYVYGKYQISIGQNSSSHIINKKLSGKLVNYGATYCEDPMFDNFGTRKLAFSKKSNSQVLSEIIGNQGSNKNIVDSTAVKKYTKNHKRKK